MQMKQKTKNNLTIPFRESYNFIEQFVFCIYMVKKVCTLANMATVMYYLHSILKAGGILASFCDLVW